MRNGDFDGDGKDALATGGDGATQSGDDADINIGVGELQECTISKANDSIVVDDLIVVDPFVFEDSSSGAPARPMAWDNVTNGTWSGAEFDAMGRLLVGTEGGIWRDGDGRDDLATYQPDTVDIDLSLLAIVDAGGIPATMAEYGLLLA